MPTLDDISRENFDKLNAARRRKAAAHQEARAIVDGADAQRRSTLHRGESDRVDQLLASIERADKELAVLERQRTDLDEALSEERRNEAADAIRTRTDAGNRAPAYDRVARVGREERTYDAEKDRTGTQFLRDVGASFFGMPGANQRLARHMQEEEVERGQRLTRAAGTGAFAGLTVPQYLTDMYAPATANLRPFADICNKHPLPADGMTVNISRITTSTSVALQTAENTAVAEQDIDDTLLTENVQTAAGQQTLSRQAIERGTGIEDVTLGDMFRRYATTLDNTLLNQSTTGLNAVAQSIAYTDGTPTAAELYPKLNQGAAGVEAALLGMAVPSHVVMHSRRWYWLQSQVGPNWPAVAQPGIPNQNIATNNASAYGSGARGVLPNGMLAIADNNVITNNGAGTNEDVIYVVPADECHLWEDPDAPVFIRAEQPKAGSLGVLLVVYGYFAYSYRRYPNAMQAIQGTGLATPTF